MDSAFAFDGAPFDLLAGAEQALVRETFETRHLAAGEVFALQGSEATHAARVLGGHLQQTQSDGSNAVFGPGDIAGVREALAGRCEARVTALDAVVMQTIPRDVLRELVAANAGFAGWLFADLARRLLAPAQREEQRELLSLLMARVVDADLREPFFVDAAQNLVSVCRQLAERGLTHALVRDGERLGMFTTIDLRDALLRDTAPAALTVGAVARFDLVTVPAQAQVFEALLAMIRHRVHRVPVTGEGGAVLGVLSQLDLMGFVSNHSHLISLQIERAGNIAELQKPAERIDSLIELLHGSGVRVEVISALVRELNAQLIARLWRLVAPEALQAQSCVVVMGSEGRGEQILKTDQDNALLLRDGADVTGLAEITERFTAALIGFGYPRCPGDIMVSNALWRQPLAQWRETLREWVYSADPKGVMQLAIFIDAAAVAGDATLLAEAKAHLFNIVADSDAFLARFAAAADQFAQSPPGWWERLLPARERAEETIDLKKLGTFPIVHGVRALALQYRIEALATTERLSLLAAGGHLAAPMAADLTEALHALMALKLKNNLRQRQLGHPASNAVRLAELGTLERDTLRDALAIVRGFRQHLQRHFRFEAL